MGHNVLKMQDRDRAVSDASLVVVQLTGDSTLVLQSATGQFKENEKMAFSKEDSMIDNLHDSHTCPVTPCCLLLWDDSAQPLLSKRDQLNAWIDDPSPRTGGRTLLEDILAKKGTHKVDEAILSLLSALVNRFRLPHSFIHDDQILRWDNREIFRGEKVHLNSTLSRLIDGQFTLDTLNPSRQRNGSHMTCAPLESFLRPCAEGNLTLELRHMLGFTLVSSSSLRCLIACLSITHLLSSVYGDTVHADPIVGDLLAYVSHRQATCEHIMKWCWNSFMPTRRLTY